MWHEVLRVLGQLVEHARQGDPVKAMVTAIVMLAAVVIILAVPLGIVAVILAAAQ